jgi:hypothetical protein
LPARKTQGLPIHPGVGHRWSCCRRLHACDTDSMAFVVEGLGDWVIRRLRRLRPDRLAAQRKLECVLRVIGGSQRGLSRRWTQVIATVSPGRLDIAGRWWSDLVVTVPVVSVRGPARRPSSKEASMSVSAGCRIVQVVTPTATLEWAMMPDQLPWAVAHVQPSEADPCAPTDEPPAV